MKNYNLSELAQKPFSIQKITQCMVSFFTQITDFCLKNLSDRLEPKKSTQLQTSLHNLPKFDESQSSLHEAIDKKIETQKRKRKKKFQTKPQFLQMKPKAPTSSYLIYLHSAKNEISAKYNITNVAELTKLVSLEWKKLPERQKEKYSSKSELQKQRYKEQMQVYRQKYADEIKDYKKRKQLKYKTNWIQNKKRKVDGETNGQKKLKIDEVRKKLRFQSQILSQEDLLTESSQEKNIQKLITRPK